MDNIVPDGSIPVKESRFETVDFEDEIGGDDWFGFAGQPNGFFTNDLSRCRQIGRPDYRGATLSVISR
ncbi:MAG: hypothetical protein AAFP90_12095 [Planctomycetota bacterium]